MSDINNFTPLWGVWEIEAILGEGNFGKAYKAVREDFGRRYDCAIKHISLPQSDAEVKQLLDEQMSNDISIASNHYRQIVEDIASEIEIMHTLRGNTNIVAYEDHLILPKKSGVGYDIFIRMELLKELSERVKESELTENDVVKLGIDVCTALEVCAAKNLIHRDIKPQNIFINADGNYKLGDFGISRQLEKTTGGLSKKGTYSYMAPEVYKGQEYGANVDVYSLGILMYRLLNRNRLPFYPDAPAPIRYDDNQNALKRRIYGEEMPAPVSASEALAKIILKMCIYNRNERYKTASEVKNELMRIANPSQRVMPTATPAKTSPQADEQCVDTLAEQNIAFRDYGHDPQTPIGIPRQVWDDYGHDPQTPIEIPRQSQDDEALSVHGDNESLSVDEYADEKTEGIFISIPIQSTSSTENPPTMQSDNEIQEFEKTVSIFEESESIPCISPVFNKNFASTPLEPGEEILLQHQSGTGMLTLTTRRIAWGRTYQNKIHAHTSTEVILTDITAIMRTEASDIPCFKIITKDGLVHEFSSTQSSSISENTAKRDNIVKHLIQLTKLEEYPDPAALAEELRLAKSYICKYCGGKRSKWSGKCKKCGKGDQRVCYKCGGKISITNGGKCVVCPYSWIICEFCGGEMAGIVTQLCKTCGRPQAY